MVSFGRQQLGTSHLTRQRKKRKKIKIGAIVKNFAQNCGAIFWGSPRKTSHHPRAGLFVGYRALGAVHRSCRRGSASAFLQRPFTNVFYSQDVLERGIFVGLFLFWHHDIPGFMQEGHVLSRISFVYRGKFGGGVFAARLWDIRR